MGISKFIHSLFRQEYKQPELSEGFKKLKESMENNPEWSFGRYMDVDIYWARCGSIFDNTEVKFEADKVTKLGKCDWMTYNENKELYKIIKTGYYNKLPFQIKQRQDYNKEKEDEQLKFVDSL